MDRNFPGIALIRRMIQVTHVLIRLKSDITVTKAGDFLPDGVRTWPTSAARTEDPDAGHRVLRPRGRPGRAGDVLPGHRPARLAGPPGIRGGRRVQVAVGRISRPRCARPKSAIRGAFTGPIFRSHCPDMIRQEHAAWITGTELAARPLGKVRLHRRRTSPGSPCIPGRSPSPLPAAPPSPASAPGPPPPACPPPSPPPAARPPSVTWADAASPSTCTGTATTRPRPGRHSPPPDAAPPPASPRHDHPLRPHRRLNPGPAASPDSCTRLPWNRPPPRSAIRASPMRHEHDH